MKEHPTFTGDTCTCHVCRPETITDVIETGYAFTLVNANKNGEMFTQRVAPEDFFKQSDGPLSAPLMADMIDQTADALGDMAAELDIFAGLKFAGTIEELRAMVKSFTRLAQTIRTTD
jgi:hypothetical protein